MKIIAKTLRIIADTFTLGVLGAIIGLIALPVILGYKPYIVQSGSMEPVIHTGSLAYINTKDTDITTGDIITYQIDENKLVTHRVDSLSDDGGFITKGDANDAVDMNTVYQDQIVGTYKFSIDKAGYIMAKRDKLIPVACIWIAGLQCIALLANKLAYKDEEDDQGDGN